MVNEAADIKREQIHIMDPCPLDGEDRVARRIEAGQTARRAGNKTANEHRCRQAWAPNVGINPLVRI